MRRPTPEEIERIRKASGEVDSTDPLVDFFYILLRDYLTAGVVEGLIDMVVEDREDLTQFCNGWTAEHAKDIVKRLRPTRSAPEIQEEIDTLSETRFSTSANVEQYLSALNALEWVTGYKITRPSKWFDMEETQS